MPSLIFFGSDQYSAIVLSRLLSDSNLTVFAVITDRAKPKGRDQITEPNPVESIALRRKIKVIYYPNNKEETPSLTTLIQKLNPTTAVAASFDHLLPPAIIALFPGKIINVHPSLLPQYRNVSPVQYAIAMGDRETGVSLFKISEGIDNGEIVAQVTEKVHEDDTTPTLSQRLFEKGATLLLDYFTGSPTSQLADSPISRNLIFTKRLTRDSGYLEWPTVQKLLAGQNISTKDTANPLLLTRLQVNSSGNILHDLVRALTPWPGVWTLVPTKKGELRLSFVSAKPAVTVKPAGKPKAISWFDFRKYYL